MHPTDTQVGIYIWDLDLLTWRKPTFHDFRELFESGSHYKRQIAYHANGEPEYMGLALPGTSIASIGWKIFKYSYDVNKRMISVEFADGEDSFGFVWNDYLTYSYS